MVLPVGDGELAAAGAAVGGVGVVGPLPPGLLQQLHLKLGIIYTERGVLSVARF